MEAKVFGQVQGIGFRFETEDKAKSSGVTGFVRNENGGSVIIVAEAEEEVLEDFLEWLRVGSFSPYIENIDVSFIDELEGFENFEVKF